MFQFSGSPPYAYLFTIRCMESFHAGFPIRIPADHRICAPPRSFSQLVASFVGSWCQGIHPVLFLLDRLLPRDSVRARRLLLLWFSFDVFLSSSGIPTGASSLGIQFLWCSTGLLWAHRPTGLCSPPSLFWMGLALFVKGIARQPPAFPRPPAPVSSAGYVFTVVFGMGTGVSHIRIATGQSLFLFAILANKALTHRLPTLPLPF